jgi:hypothetical protein
VRGSKARSLLAWLLSAAAGIDNSSCEMKLNIMTGYPDITYARLNAKVALARSLTWLRCLDAAISKLHPYHVVPTTGRKGTPSLRDFACCMATTNKLLVAGLCRPVF